MTYAPDLVETRYGRMLVLPNDLYVGRSLVRYGEFSDLEVEFVRDLLGSAGAGVILDIGANIGALTLPLARATPRRPVYAYEPQRPLFQMLAGNLALNRIDNVVAHWAAVGANGGAVLVPSFDYGAKLNFGGVEMDATGEGERVRRVTLDMEFKKGPAIAFAKIDVEGMESDVLDGARTVLRRDRPLLYVEGDRQEKLVGLVGRLDLLGYRLFWHLPPLFNPDNFAGDEVNVFGSIVSMNLVGIPRERDVPLCVAGLAEVEA